MSSSFASSMLMRLAVALSTTVAIALSATPAWAGPGYRLATSGSTIALQAEIPVGLAIDQSSQVIYVAEASRDLFNVQPGEVEQLSASGTPTASSPFGTGGQDFFVSVAVNPVTHGIYAYQIEGSTPQGQKGVSKMSSFSSSGVLETSFFPANAHAGTLAADSSGRVYFPNNTTSSVQIFNSAGTLEGSVTCGGCPGGAFVTPQSVALDSTGKLYVVDSAGGGRVVKFAPSGGSYVYESTLQSGAGAVAVAVDSASDDVIVGNLVGGRYHVVAYDSTGTAFDDFGDGAVSHSPIEAITGQLAVNATTHKIYLSNPGGQNLRVFERIASIPAPLASVSAPSPLGQTKATLRGEIDSKGHGITQCEFQLVSHAQFLANGFANPTTFACSPVAGEEGIATITVVSGSLQPSTGYDYRLEIASFGGAAESSTQHFETLPPLPPEATTGSASALTKTSATLAGSVNPKGGVVSDCHFEWVTEQAFQTAGFSGANTQACTPTPSGTTAVSVSAKISGLNIGTSYRFRVLATNNSGSTQATDKTFATPAETCAENAALCSPPGETPQEPAPAPVVALPPTGSPAPPTGRPKPLKCRKGTKKKRVRGKLKCVRVKKHRAKR